VYSIKKESDNARVEVVVEFLDGEINVLQVARAEGVEHPERLKDFFNFSELLYYIDSL